MGSLSRTGNSIDKLSWEISLCIKTTRVHLHLRGCMDLMLPAVLNRGILLLTVGRRAGFIALDTLGDFHTGLCMYSTGGNGLI